MDCLMPGYFRVQLVMSRIVCCGNCFTSQDSLTKRKFIDQAVDSYRKALQDCKYADHLKSMNESVFLDAPFVKKYFE